MKAAKACAALGYVGRLSCVGIISRFGRQARLGERGASGAITKTEFAANRYRDFRRVNSLQGLMLTHRPCELSRLKPAAFATPSDTKPLTGSRKDTKSATLEKHCIICEERACWSSSSEFEFEKGMVKIPFSHSNS